MDEAEVTKLRVINNISIFAGIGLHEQHILADKCRIVEEGEEKIVIEQGEIGDRLYGIIEGRVLVSSKSKLKEWIQINTLEPGDVFGEIAILLRIPTTTRVTTLTPCTFLTINANDFLRAYQYFPPHSRDNIQAFIAKRLEQLRAKGVY